MEILWIAIILVGVGVIIFFTKKLDNDKGSIDDHKSIDDGTKGDKK